MKKFLVPTLFIFILTIAITWFVERELKQVWIYKIAFPEQSALDDFEFEDFSFSNRKTFGFKDENIVLINIGDLDRRGIAKQIEVIDKYHPKAIGINVFFNCDQGLRDTINCPQLIDQAGNLMLHEAIKKSEKVVLVSKILETKRGTLVDEYDSVELSDPGFSDYSKNGFANLPTNATNQFDIKSCRSFIPKVTIKGIDQFAFSIEVCKKFDSIKTSHFLFNAREEEIISYRGNISIQNDFDTTYKHLDYYKTYDAKEIINGKIKREDIEGKIILMGYLGDYLSDKRMDAMFYSPLNQKPLGKSLPDMYGLVVNANIISMIIHEDFINKMSNKTSFFISVVVVLLNIWFFIWLEHRKIIWNEVFIILVPATQIIFLALLRYFVFSLYNYIIDLSSTTILLVTVSLSTTLYFGPILHSVNKLKLVIKKQN